jgi:hypothetical protein
MGGVQGNVRTVNADQFAMGAGVSLDAGSQGNVTSENSSLSEGTAKFYAKTQEFNICQQMKYPFAVSDKRLSATQNIDTTNIDVATPAPTTPDEFERAAGDAMRQMQLDAEFTIIQGTYTARSAVGTSQASGGLLDPGATIGISTNTVNASSASFNPLHLSNLMQTMGSNGAVLSRPVLVCPLNFVPVLSDAYGFQEQSNMVGGVAIKTINTDFGVLPVVGTAQCLANTIVIADLDYLTLVYMPYQDGTLIKMKEYVDGASARKGYIEAHVGVDYGLEAYHGKIYGLATPSFTV